jgi:hypothetical protein
MNDLRDTISKALSLSRSAGKQINEGVSELREHIQGYKRERVKMASLPVPKETALQRAEAVIDHITEGSRYMYPSPQTFARPDYSGINTNVISIIAAQMASAMADRLKAEIEVYYGANHGLTEEERNDRFREIDRKILDAELAEESLIRSAEDSGFPIIRRRDADPRAVLAHDKVLP